MHTRRGSIALVGSALLTAPLVGGAAAQKGAGLAAGRDTGPTPVQVAGAASTSKLPETVFYGVARDQPREKQELIEEVGKVLERELPQNPGRQKTFGKMALRGLTPQNRQTHLLKQTGWYLQLEEAARIPGGWRATVSVHAIVTRLDGSPATVMNRHFETYVYRGGKLILEDDYIDPQLQFWNPPYHPSEGLIPNPIDSVTPPNRRKPPDPFVVNVQWEGTSTVAEQKLAEEVVQELRRRRPENPRRMRSFPKLDFTWYGPDGKPQPWKMKLLGWKVSVRWAERIPGGWRARVYVYGRLRNSEGFEPPMITNHHIEVYTFRDGKLNLESDSIDPRHDPEKGLHSFP